MAQGGMSGGMWYRASRYEFEDGMIRPAVDATIELYDPWAHHVPAQQRRRAVDGRAPRSDEDVRPYQSLLSLAHSLRDAETGIPTTAPSERQQHKIIEWCGANGLLGILPHQVDTVLFPAVARDGESTNEAHNATSHGYRRASLGWEHIEIPTATKKTASRPQSSPATARSRGTLSTHVNLTSRVMPDPQTGGAIYRSLPDGVLHEDGLDGEWSLFFRDSQSASRWPFPSFADEEFWRVYGEPVAWFVDIACLLDGALTMLAESVATSATGETSHVPGDSGLDALNAIAAMASPAVRSVDDSGVELRWTTPSLLASYAIMLQIDLTGGAAVRLCDVCAAPFVTKTGWRHYCSATCRTTHNKRVQRQRKARAIELSAEGWDVERIAKEVEAHSVKVVRGWIREKGHPS